MISVRLADDGRVPTVSREQAFSGLDRNQRREVPPDVTDGRVVVVVGGSVVGTVVGAGAVGTVPLDGAAPSAGFVVVVGDVVVVSDLDTDDGDDAPGCWCATSTPKNAVAPPASATDVRVTRWTRRCARARAAGE